MNLENRVLFGTGLYEKGLEISIVFVVCKRAQAELSTCIAVNCKSDFSLHSYKFHTDEYSNLVLLLLLLLLAKHQTISWLAFSKHA